MVKNCDLGLENAVFSRPRSQFFTIRTSQLANNIYVFRWSKYGLHTFCEYLQICQQKTIQGKTDEEDVKIAASIEIQRVWRGYFTR